MGVGEGAEFAGAVVADGVDADDLAVLGQLDRPGDDGHLDRGVGPAAPGAVAGAGEADRAAAVGQAGHGQSGDGVSGSAGDACPRGAVGKATTEEIYVHLLDEVTDAAADSMNGVLVDLATANKRRKRVLCPRCYI